MIAIAIFISLYFVFKRIGPAKTLFVILLTFVLFPDGIIKASDSSRHIDAFRNLFSNTYLLVTFLSIYGLIWYKYLPIRLRKTYFLILFLIISPQLFSTLFSILEKFFGVNILSRDIGIIGNIFGLISRYVAPFGLFPIGYLIVTDENQKSFFIKKVLPTLSYLGVFLAIYGTLQLFSPYRFIELADTYIYQQFRLTHLSSRDPNGAVRNLIFPLLASFILGFILKNKIYNLYFFVILAAIILTFSRSGWVSVGLSLVFIFLIIMKNRKQRILSFVSIVLIYLTFSILYEYRDQIFGYDEYESIRVKTVSTFEDRIVLWKIGVEALTPLKIIFGNGPFSAQFYTGIDEGKFVMTSIHNTYLFYLYELGIFSLLALLLLYYYFLVKYNYLNVNIYGKNNETFLIFRILSLGLVIFTFFHSFTEPSTVFFVSLSLGFLFGIHYRPNNNY
ncbi:MAG: O-antigen ligase family protein [Candidatus Woesearchaeota archaeon]